MMGKDNVEILEVCPRDGLQPEPVFVETGHKIELIKLLSETGLRRIEVTSFAHPKWVPQLKDAREVFAGIGKKEGITYIALIPNMRGLEAAIECGVCEVVTVISASESHNKKNINKSISESLKEIEEINKIARANDIRVRSSVATVFGCPIEGFVDPEKVKDIALALESFGAFEISLGDTTGMAHPLSAYKIPAMLKGVLRKAEVAVHFHKYYGLETANNLASYNAGVRIFEGAAGGLGGCPYAPGAKGNCATEILVEMFERMGVVTGIDRKKMYEAAAYAQGLSTLLRQCG